MNDYSLFNPITLIFFSRIECVSYQY